MQLRRRSGLKSLRSSPSCGPVFRILACAVTLGCSDGVTSPEPVGSLFVPADALTQEGDTQNYSPFGGPGRRFQSVYRPSDLGGIPAGGKITGIRFRLDQFATVPIEGDITNFEVRLSTFARGLGNLDPAFAENRGVDEVITRTGPLAVASGDYSVGGSPNAFGPVIDFERPFTYVGGSLLLEVGTTGIAVGSIIDGVLLTDGSQSAYGAANGFNTTSADLGIFGDVPVIEYLFARP